MGSRIVPLTNHHSRYFCRPVHGWFWQIMSKIAADFFGSASLVLTGVRWKKSLCDKKNQRVAVRQWLLKLSHSRAPQLLLGLRFQDVFLLRGCFCHQARLRAAMKQ